MKHRDYDYGARRVAFVRDRPQTRGRAKIRIIVHMHIHAYIYRVFRHETNKRCQLIQKVILGKKSM